MPSAGNLPTIYHEEFMPIFDRWGEKRTTASTESKVQQYYLLSQLANFANVLWYDNTNIRVPASYQTDLLTSVDIAKLLIVYHALYPEERNIDISDLHFTIKKFSTIFVGAEKFGSKAESRTLRSARVLISATSPLSHGTIDYFMCHKLTVNGMEREHYFACVRWFKRHPRNQCLESFNTLCVWDANNFEPRASSYFLPVYWIHNLSNGAYLTLDNVKLMAVCLIPRSATILLASIYIHMLLFFLIYLTINIIPRSGGG